MLKQSTGVGAAEHSGGLELRIRGEGFDLFGIQCIVFETVWDCTMGRAMSDWHGLGWGNKTLTYTMFWGFGCLSVWARKGSPPYHPPGQISKNCVGSLPAPVL